MAMLLLSTQHLLASLTAAPLRPVLASLKSQSAGDAMRNLLITTAFVTGMLTTWGIAHATSWENMKPTPFNGGGFKAHDIVFLPTVLQRTSSNSDFQKTDIFGPTAYIGCTLKEDAGIWSRVVQQNNAFSWSDESEKLRGVCTYLMAQAYYIERTEQSNGTNVYCVNPTAVNVGPTNPNEPGRVQPPCLWTFF